MNQELKRHAVSAGITFFSAFLIALGTTFQTIDMGTAITASVFLSLVFTAVRAAVKVTLESTLLK